MNDTSTIGVVYISDAIKTGGSCQMFEYIYVKRSFLEWVSYLVFWAEKPPQKFIAKQIDIESIKYEPIENAPFRIKFINCSDAADGV